MVTCKTSFDIPGAYPTPASHTPNGITMRRPAGWLLPGSEHREGVLTAGQR